MSIFVPDDTQLSKSEDDDLDENFLLPSFSCLALRSDLDTDLCTGDDDVSETGSSKAEKLEWKLDVINKLLETWWPTNDTAAKNDDPIFRKPFDLRNYTQKNFTDACCKMRALVVDLQAEYRKESVDVSKVLDPESRPALSELMYLTNALSDSELNVMILEMRRPGAIPSPTNTFEADVHCLCADMLGDGDLLLDSELRDAAVMHSCCSSVSDWNLEGEGLSSVGCSRTRRTQNKIFSSRMSRVLPTLDEYAS